MAQNLEFKYYNNSKNLSVRFKGALVMTYDFEIGKITMASESVGLTFEQIKEIAEELEQQVMQWPEYERWRELLIPIAKKHFDSYFYHPPNYKIRDYGIFIQDSVFINQYGVQCSGSLDKDLINRINNFLKEWPKDLIIDHSCYGCDDIDYTS